MPPVTVHKSTPLDQRIAEAGGPVPLTVLVVCGEMMRRSRHPSSARPEETERALGALSVADAAAGLAGVDLTSVKTELLRAFEESFEAGFADDGEERALFASSAMTALQARDRVASALGAAKARLAIATAKGDDSKPLTAAIQRVEETASALDRELSGRVRSLTGVNRERRAELAKLDVEQRAEAWWYSARSDKGDDQLLVALGGADGAELGKDASADLASSALPTLDEAGVLRRASLGDVREEERAWLHRRAEKDPALREALSLASDGTIEQAE